MDAPTISSFSTQQQTPTGNVGGASTNGQALALGSVDDLFAQLKEFQWKGVAFPSTEDDVEIRQDLVIHRFADRNGGYVEGTGRHPVQITARIPFLNYIYAGTNETWPQGALYPYQWRLFIVQCLEGTSGILQHPELGPLNCKIDLAKTSWSGKVRGGVWVQATWIESDDTQADQLGQDLSASSPIAQLTATADDLDENILTLAAALGAQANPLPALEFTFADLAASLVGVIDVPTILQKEFQGRVDNVLYQCGRVETSLSSANETLGPLSWPLYQDCERTKDAAYTVQAQAAIAQKRTVLQKRLPKDSTIAGAALYVGADLTDFILLNYALVSTPVVAAGTKVSYYDPASA
jgi:hypothetical protein